MTQEFEMFDKVMIVSYDNNIRKERKESFVKAVFRNGDFTVNGHNLIFNKYGRAINAEVAVRKIKND